MIEISKGYRGCITISELKLKDTIKIIKSISDLDFSIESELFYDLINSGGKDLLELLTKVKIDCYYGIKFHYIIKCFNKNQLERFLNKNQFKSNSLSWNLGDDHLKDFSVKDHIDKIELAYDILKKNKKGSVISLLDVLICEYNKKRITDERTLKKLVDADEDLVKFMYLHNLQWVINEHSVRSLTVKNPDLHDYIGQKFLGTHDLDKALIKMFNTSHKSIWDIKNRLSEESIDLEYVVNGIKYCNKTNLKILSEHFGWRIDHYYARWDKNWRPNGKVIKRTDKNDKTFTSLAMKFSKYILQNNVEADFIKNYIARKNKNEK